MIGKIVTKVILKAIVYSIPLIVIGCAGSGSIHETAVGNQEITGRVIDSKTSGPISASLIIFTLPEGNRWNLPSSFLLGYTFSESNGEFQLPANPTIVKELRHSHASITIDTYHPHYNQGVAFAPRNKKTDNLNIKMKKKSVLDNDNVECSYNNPEICKIVKNYLGR